MQGGGCGHGRPRCHCWRLDSGDLRYVDLNFFDFSCLTPVRGLDVHEDLSGDVSGNFIDCTHEINLDLIDKALDTETIPEFTDEVRKHFAVYPETFECTTLPPDVVLKGPGVLDVTYEMNEQDIARIKLTGTTEAFSLIIKLKLKNTRVFSLSLT